MHKRLPLYNTYKKRLSKTALFKGLDPALLDDMLRHFRVESWRKGTVQNSRITLERFYIIHQGRMQLLQTHPQTGKQIGIVILGEGDVHDVLTLLDGKEHPVVPTALDDLQLLSAPLNRVRAWVDEHPDFNRNFMPYLARRIRMHEALAADLSLYDIETRLARTILRYASLDDTRFPEERQHQAAIDVALLHDLTNEKLAQMVGSARQVVNRHLQHMKKEGVLHFENHHLIIDDLRKLRDHADDLHQALV